MVYLIIVILQLVLVFFLSSLIIRNISRIVLRIHNSRNLVMYAIAGVFLVGTFIHELSHLIVASLLGVKVHDFNILPEKNEDSIKLGHVTLAKSDPFRRSLIGVAPFVSGMLIIFGLSYYFSSAGLTKNYYLSGIGFVLLFQISNTMFSSRRDLEGSWLLAFILLVIIALVYLTGSFEVIFETKIVIDSLNLIIKSLNLVLIIDLVGLIIFYLIRRIIRG